MGGDARTASPNCPASESSICDFVFPAAISLRMNILMFCAIGASDWSTVVPQTGHMTSPSSSFWGRMPLARKRGRDRDERDRHGAEQHPHAGLSAPSTMRVMSALSSSPTW